MPDQDIHILGFVLIVLVTSTDICQSQHLLQMLLLPLLVVCWLLTSQGLIEFEPGDHLLLLELDDDCPDSIILGTFGAKVELRPSTILLVRLRELSLVSLERVSK